MPPYRPYLSRVRRAYRRAVAPLARRKLRTMRGDGLPEPFQHPLAFLLGEPLSRAEQQVVARVESIRASVAGEARSYEVVNRDGEVCPLTAAQIARGVSIDPEWGTFLYLCSRSFGARTIVELGACAGISGCYLASSEHCERFVSVEASPGLASLAGANVRQVFGEAEIVNAQFDSALDSLLPTMRGGIDLAFIDGHHRYETTLHYFGRLEPLLNPGALIVLDDIHLSRGMWSAWQDFKRRAGFGYTVSAGRLGLCLWDGSFSTPVSYDLCPYFACLNVSPRRFLLPLSPKHAVA